jgi:hypothetical protein
MPVRRRSEMADHKDFFAASAAIAGVEVLERFAIPLPDTISLDLLPIIVKAEIDGDAGYQDWADREPDPEVSRLLRLNGHEETHHGERVSEAIAILEASE